MIGTNNSTFLSSNMESIAFNYAVFDGNSNVVSGLARYNAQLTSLCGPNHAKSMQDYNQLLQSVHLANSSLAVRRNELSCTFSNPVL